MVYLVVILIRWLAESRNDHQIKCMPLIEPFILQAWVTFYVILKITNLNPTNSVS